MEGKRCHFFCRMVHVLRVIATGILSPLYLSNINVKSIRSRVPNIFHAPVLPPRWVLPHSAPGSPGTREEVHRSPPARHGLAAKGQRWLSKAPASAERKRARWDKDDFWWLCCCASKSWETESIKVVFHNVGDILLWNDTVALWQAWR